jgi:hypothetical protein
MWLGMTVVAAALAIHMVRLHTYKEEVGNQGALHHFYQ